MWSITPQHSPALVVVYTHRGIYVLQTSFKIHGDYILRKVPRMRDISFTRSHQRNLIIDLIDQ